VVRGQDAYRIAAPDAEIDLGLTADIEFDLDGQFAIGGPDSGEFTFNHLAPDNLWPAIKTGVLDIGDSTANVAWTLGVQVGPKLPVTNTAQGVGVEGLLLLGCRYHPAHYVLTLGGLRDPATDGPHPSGPEMGIDIDQPLDDAEHWSLKAQIGAV